MVRALRLTVLVLLATAPAAAAESLVAVGAGPAPLGSAGPALTPDGAAWAEVGPLGTTRFLVSEPGERRARVRATVPLTPGADSALPFVDGAGSQLLLGVHHERCDPCIGPALTVGAFVAAGPASGPLARLRDVVASTSGARLAGDRVAHARTDDDGGVTIRFDDPAGDAAPITVPTTSDYGWDVAGDFLVHRAMTDPVVVNWRTGQELYRPELPGPRYQWMLEDIQEDGKVLWRGYPHLAVTSAEQPAAREIPLREAATYGAALARDRIAFQWSSIGSNPEGSGFDVAELDGRLVGRAQLRSGFTVLGDFDGRRLTWMARVCRVPVAVVWDVAAPQPKLRTKPCGAPLVAGRPRLEAGRLQVALRCPPGGAAACLTDVRATVRGSGGARAVRRAKLTSAAGETVTASLGASLPRALRRRGVRVTIRAATAAGRPDARVARFRL